MNEGGAMGNILKIETVHQCNCCFGSKTLHPLVSVIDLSEVELANYAYIKFGFYTVFLQEYSCNDFIRGRRTYDYSDGTLLFLAPGKYLSLEEEGKACQTKGWILAFHPDLIRGTSLGEHVKDYTFFTYETGESLHISSREKQEAIECFQRIRKEIRHDIDVFSKILISRNIELFLDYCRRFYERQFITRHGENTGVLQQLDARLDEYILGCQLKTRGIPNEMYCANALHLSPAYFSDLLRHETGMDIQEYMQVKRMDTAREWVLHTDKPIAEIADVLGFPNAPYFSRVFKKLTGCSPGEYRGGRESEI